MSSPSTCRCRDCRIDGFGRQLLPFWLRPFIELNLKAFSRYIYGMHPRPRFWIGSTLTTREPFGRAAIFRRSIRSWATPGSLPGPCVDRLRARCLSSWVQATGPFY